MSQQEAYEAGFDAYLAGGDNPYPRGSVNYDVWEQGWSDGWIGTN